MSPSGKEAFYTLREAFRSANFRRFRAKNKQNRWADFVGFGPDGTTLLGWFDGSGDVQHFDPDTRTWSNITVYLRG